MFEDFFPPQCRHSKDIFNNGLYIILLVIVFWIHEMWILQRIWVFVARITFYFLLLIWAFE